MNGGKHKYNLAYFSIYDKCLIIQEANNNLDIFFTKKVSSQTFFYQTNCIMNILRGTDYNR
jgi:hypothetical protein